MRTLAATAIALGTLAAPAAAGATTLIGSGSSAAQPYMLALFRGYSQLHKNIQFKYIADGGNAGVKDVQAHGAIQFSINTRPPLASDAHTTYMKLFLDGLCVDVNSSNSISNIAISDLKNIFLGFDTNWTQVPGSNLTTTLDPIGRNSSAGQYTFFQQSVLGGATQSSNVLQAGSDGLVATAITKDPHQSAIGYVGLAHATGSGLKTLSINGVACDRAEIRSETYPLFRFDWGVFPTSNPNPQVLRFFSWVRSSAAAGAIINRAGAVAAFNQ